jgi:hypothetical protein
MINGGPQWCTMVTSSSPKRLSGIAFALKGHGAGDENRTRVLSLGMWCCGSYGFSADSGGFRTPVPINFGQAVSTGQRNELGEFLHRHHIAERFAWSSVETSLDSQEVFW